MSKRVRTDFVADVRSGVKSGITGVRKALKMEIDPELRTYERMSDSHFNTLKSEFGSDEVTNYIKEMEARRLKKRR